ncbi:alpha/beta fold hydrolase [Nocardia caishijiensis]|uniref:Pimeloyl-ACP methyl ester carboxylesterase n=1 Tax=Nocardia caishijiensis TaxID=184756 RepID=A0ABQ6YGC6_9NOCA|nr:alpha/beta hydrolase [Nocardia caishijiensis]KAF0844824.1 pimeloyl-ACP methyl ester carboxylesterase [Nocardia caishijiensis]
MTKPFELHEVTVDGAVLRYVDVGQGDPLVLLHGWPESHAAWRHQIGPLSRSARVIAPDWQGWGASARDLRLSCDYDTEVDRIGRMFDALNLDRVDLACHDYGGFLGLGFVQRYPERVRRFAILNSRAHRTFTTPYYQLFGLISALARRPLLRPILTARTIRIVHRLGLAQFVRNGSFDTERLDAYLDFLDTREGRRWYAHFWAGYSVRVRPELAAGLGAVRCPTSVIWGDQDPAIPFRYAEDLAAAIPAADLVRIHGGHFIMEQRPADVTAALQAWLRRPAVITRNAAHHTESRLR